MDPETITGTGTPEALVTGAGTPEGQVAEGTINLPDPEAQARSVEQPPATPSPESVELAQLRQEHSQVQDQLEEYQARERRWELDQGLNQQVAGHQRRWEDHGLAPEQAQAVATEYIGLQRRALGAMQGFHANIRTGLAEAVQRKIIDAETAGHVNMIIETALEHRDPTRLRKQIGEQFGIRAELAAVRREFAEFKRSHVPPQNYDTGASGGPTGGFNPRSVSLDQLSDPAFYLKHADAITKAQQAGELAHLAERYT